MNIPLEVCNCSFLHRYLLSYNLDSFLLLDGRKEEIHFDKITSRIQKLCYGLNMDFVDPVSWFSVFSALLVA